MSGKNDLRFVATCAAGMEELIGEEIVSFGGDDVQVRTGLVQWLGSLGTAYTACLWSRFSSKIMLHIKSMQIKGSDELYEQCTRVDWLDHLSTTLSFAVSCNISGDSVIQHSQYAALRVKDAVVDFFRSQGLERPNVDKENPDLRIHLYVDHEKAHLYLDLSGESLHRRGYREATGIAPLKETLAAAIVALSGWNKDASAEEVFLDPMCGSATLLIEAALLYGDSAPGLSRSSFGFHKWPGHDPVLWDNLVGEAVEREEAGLAKPWPRIIGYDADPKMIAVAGKNIRSAGLDDLIELRCADIAHLPEFSGKGCLVSNLPFGDRMSEKEEVRYLYSGVGRIFREKLRGWKWALFISQPDLTDTFNLPITKSYRLYNGPISCRLLVGDIVAKKEFDFTWLLKEHSEIDEGADFANRLRKNFKKFQKWAKSNTISCYRIYDRDLPEYNVVIDLYEKWVVVQEYRAPSTVDSDVAEKRFSLVLQHIREIFQIKRERLIIRRRSRQRGKEQYQSKGGKKRFYEVREGRCSFLVNFTHYLDTGLFLDHRPIRKRIGELSTAKRFLNLFGYTGTATVHAAINCAAWTTTVDLNANYLEWTAKNLALNGLSGFSNEIIHEDCMTWLKTANTSYDIIFIDPPTFSNTKKKDRVFDIQTDHVELIHLAMRLLAENGIVLFSTNFQKFRIQSELEDSYAMSDISSETIPYDFGRNASIHRCWEIRHRKV